MKPANYSFDVAYLRRRRLINIPFVLRCELSSCVWRHRRSSCFCKLLIWAKHRSHECRKRKHFVHRWKSEGKLSHPWGEGKSGDGKVTGRILTCPLRVMVQIFFSVASKSRPSDIQRKKSKQRKFNIKKFYSHSGRRRKKGKQTTQGCELRTRKKMNLQ